VRTASPLTDFQVPGPRASELSVRGARRAALMSGSAQAVSPHAGEYRRLPSHYRSDIAHGVFAATM